ncbi:MAG: hypothetical protein HOV83_21080 [Catenulispora sp.]|nr:hypothetical protein [Catenulispora sp.]
MSATAGDDHEDGLDREGQRDDCDGAQRPARAQCGPGQAGVHGHDDDDDQDERGEDQSRPAARLCAWAPAAAPIDAERVTGAEPVEVAGDDVADTFECRFVGRVDAYGEHFRAGGQGAGSPSPEGDRSFAVT